MSTADIFFQKKSVEKAVEAPRNYRFNHQESLAVTEVVQKTGLNPATVYRRLYKGDTLEDILKQPVKKKPAQKFMYKGKEYKVAEIAKMAKLGLPSTYQALKEGFTVEQIIKRQYHKKTYAYYEYKREKYSKKGLHRLPECKVGFKTLSKRLDAGWAVGDAVLTKWRQEEKH